MSIVQTGLTLDALLKLPEEKPALEYLDGVVTQKSWADGPHGSLQVTIAAWLDEVSRQDRSCMVFIELHSHWPGRASLCPDVSVYRTERVPTTPRGYIADDFWVPPDLAVEIATGSETEDTLTDRADLLTGLGIGVVLVIEPQLGRVRLARPGRPIVTYQGDDVVTIAEVLPAFAFSVSDLFATLRVRRPGQ